MDVCYGAEHDGLCWKTKLAKRSFWHVVVRVDSRTKVFSLCLGRIYLRSQQLVWTHAIWLRQNEDKEQKEIKKWLLGTLSASLKNDFQFLRSIQLHIPLSSGQVSKYFLPHSAGQNILLNLPFVEFFPR